MRNHWWWRPGWRPGRSFWTWHLTFGDQTIAGGAGAFREVVGYYQNHLAELPGLDLVPPQWLHLTMQGLGFVDEVPERDVQQIVAAATARCARLAPLILQLGPARPGWEGIPLGVAPTEPVEQLRAAVREAIGEVWGADRVPEPADGFTPHVSLAYCNTAGPTDPYVAALNRLEPRTATVKLRAVQLIALTRRNHLYTWEPYATVPLSEGAAG